MRNLIFVLFILTACKQEPKPSGVEMVKSIVAKGISLQTAAYLECSNEPAILATVESAFGIDNKNVVTKVFCNAFVKQVVPVIIKDNVIPAAWDCKASNVDKLLETLLTKVCGA